MIDLFILAGQPVISTDTKKKELIGEYGRAGRTWQPAGQPVQVRDHDFPEEDTARICPYGIYDIAANTGFVSVGTSHDTGAFAVNAIRLWWQHEGCLRYRDAEYLLITCDAGGSNGHRCRLWRQQLTELSQETGLSVIVLHFPPGTSKWNKVEHRLFCHITRTWSQAPLLTLDDAVAGIAAATASQGLKVTAMRDDAEYPVGTEISDRQNKDTEDRFIDRDPGHGGLCYPSSPGPAPSRNPDRAGRARPRPHRRPRGPRRHPRPAGTARGPPWTGPRPVSTSSPSNAAAPAARQATPAATAAAATGNCPSRPSSPPPPATSASA